MGCVDVSVVVRCSVMVKKLLFVVNDPGFFLSHRLPLAKAARNKGFDVQVATKGGSAVEKIEQLGFTHHTLTLSRSGRNLLNELFTLFSILRLFRHLRPDLVHLVTIKPVLYGGIAARLARVPGVISAISGLGYLFAKRASLWMNVSRYAVLFLYRLSMGHPNQRVIFQNMMDLSVLVGKGGVSKNKTRLIRGSGVDLRDFPKMPEPEGMPVVVMASRLLKDKGVYEFVEAARILQSIGVTARFQLIGAPDTDNPESITAEAIRSWQEEGVVEYLGYRTDIPHLFSQTHIITLPSYYGEGLPKVLIEAAASGRAVITTDMPGCRDAIEPGVTGLLIPIRDSNALASAIQQLIENPSLRQQMGKAGRRLAIKEFTIEKVVHAHLEIYRELMASA